MSTATDNSGSSAFGSGRGKRPRASDRSRSAVGLVSDIVANTTALLTKEARLARAEVAENMEDAATGAGTAIGGLVLTGSGLVILLQAIVVALTNAGLTLGWASLIVGGIVCLIGAALMYSGSNAMTASSLAPKRTLEQHREDRERLREKV